MLSSFVTWLKSFYSSFWVECYNNVVEFLQFCFDSLIDFFVSIVGMFPSGSAVPSVVSAPISETMTMCLITLNWLFPVAYIVTVVSFISTGMLAYLIIAPLARWAKLLT